eukprot:COSAG01_NODE_51699_length_352_cov_3.233202_1_plen_26_part_10
MSVFGRGTAIRVSVDYSGDRCGAFGT